MDERTIMIPVARELLPQLEEWSEPVQVRVIRTDDGGHTIELRTVDPKLFNE